jgi:hypothetical protein
MNKKTKFSLFAYLLTITVAILPAQAYAGCSAGGYCGVNIGPPCSYIYNYLANSDFGSDCVWNYAHASRITSGSMCTWMSSGGFAEMRYGSGPTDIAHLSHVWQTLYIPASGESGYISSSQNWTIGYRVSINDPSANYGDTLQMRLVDTTTGAVIASGAVIHGNGGNPDCNLYTVSFHANLNGRNVKVEFNSVIQPSSSNTLFDIDDVELDQNTLG